MVNKEDGFCVSCHPFRNNKRGLEANRAALRYCRELGLQPIGASDAHVTGQIGKYVTYFPEKVETGFYRGTEDQTYTASYMEWGGV